MLSKNKISLINSLKSKKGRLKNKLFLAEGNKLASEILNSKFKIKFLFATNDWLLENGDIAQNKYEELIQINEREMKKVSSLTNPQNVLCAVEIPKFHFKENELEKELSIVLDKLQDPGNLGTIIRIADWFGISNIFCSSDTVDVYNPKVVQATMGSIVRVNIHYVDIYSFLKRNFRKENFPIYGSFLNGSNIYETKLKQNGLIIFGSESNGISDDIEPFVKTKIKIPDFGDTLNSAESLNVAIATGIICSEFKRNFFVNKLE